MAFRLPILACATAMLVASTAAAQTPPPAPKKPTPGNTAPTPPAEEPKPPEPAPAPAPAPDQKENDEKEEKENKQAVYLSADIGFNRSDVGGFSDSTGFDRTGANGLLAGLGIGYRREAFRFGARFRDLSTTEFTLWALMAEVGYGLKMRPLSPTFYVHAGYVFDYGIERGAFASKLPQGNILTPNVDLEGLIIGGEVTASYWVTKFLRVGPFIGFDLTVLSRARPPLPQSLFPIPDDVRNNALFGDSGSGLGYVLSLGLRVTGDVGF
ncbi:MAG: hypothetical protein KF819_06395 [Labilithrix sp.]|nr:hypothetical protein [Labilithrix sp.]